jgi:hypothetical protein
MMLPSSLRLGFPSGLFISSTFFDHFILS